MSTAAIRGVVRQIALDDPPTDAALVTRYARTRENAPFAELLRRHGPVVLGVCRRLLADSHAAEDAFQAVFLVLARKADAIRPPGAVGNWLYGVAVRTARKAKVAAARRWRREMASAMAAVNPGREVGDNLERIELRAMIDDELGRLSADLRAAVVLCDLGGKSRGQAARELGCPEGTIAARLHRARKLLADRLTRRGVALPAAGLGAVLSPEAVTAAVSPDLARTTLAAAELFATGTAGPAVSPAAQALAEGVIRTMSTGKFKLMLVTILAAGLMTGAGALWGAAAINPPEATGGPVPAAAPDEKPPAKPAEQLGYVSHIEFSSDGKWYCVVAGRTVRVHDAATGRVLFTIRGEGAGITADGKTLLVMGQKVLECDPATGKVRKEHPRPRPKWGWHLVAFSPDGKRYAAHSGFHVRVYDTATGFEPVQLEGQHDPGGGLSSDGLEPPEIGSQLVWSPDDKQVVGVGVLVRTRLGGLGLGTTGWEVKTGNRFYSFESGIEDGPRAAAFSPDSKAIAVGYKDHVDLWTGGLNSVRKLPTAGPVTALAFSPDGKQVAAGVRLPIHNGADKEPAVVGHKTVVQLLDVATRKELKRFDGFEGVNHMAPTRLPVVALAFAPDGKKLLAGTSLPPVVPLPNDFPKTGEVKAFSLDDKAAPAGPPAAAGPWREKAVVADIDGLVTSVAFAPDGKTFAAGGPGIVMAWDAESAKKLWDHTFRVAGLPQPAGVAFSTGGGVAGTHPGGVTLLDAATGKTTGEIEEKGATPRAVAFGPAAERVAGRPLHRLAFTDGKAVWAKTWIDGGEPGTARFGPLAGAPKIDGTPPAGVAYSPDGKRLVFIPNYKVDPASPFGKPDPAKATHWIAQVWGGGSGAPMMVLPHGTDPVTAVAWSPDGKLIATGAADGSVILWDAATGKEVGRTEPGGRGRKNAIRALAFAPDGKTLAAATDFKLGRSLGWVVLLDVSNGNRVQVLDTFTAPPVAVAFSPDGKTLVVGCGNPDADPRKLTPEQRKKAGEVRVFTTEPAPVKPAAPVPERPAPVMWKQTDELFPGKRVATLAWAADGKTFAAGGADGEVVVGNRTTGKAFVRFRPDPETLRPIQAVALAPGGKLLAVAVDGRVTLHDPATGKAVDEPKIASPAGDITPAFISTALVFSPDGKLLAVHSCGVGHSAPLTRLIDMATGEDICERDWPAENRPAGGQPVVVPNSPSGRDGPMPSAVAFSPDGKRLAVSVNVRSMRAIPQARVVEVKTGKLVAELDDLAAVSGLAWSPDGNRLAAGAPDGRVVTWDAATFKTAHSTKSVDGTFVTAVAFSPDGSTLAAAVMTCRTRNSDGTLAAAHAAEVRLYDAVSLTERQRLHGPTADWVSVLAFAPDGTTLLAGCGPIDWFPEPLPEKDGGGVRVYRPGR